MFGYYFVYFDQILLDWSRKCCSVGSWVWRPGSRWSQSRWLIIKLRIMLFTQLTLVWFIKIIVLIKKSSSWALDYMYVPHSYCRNEESNYVTFVLSLSSVLVLRHVLHLRHRQGQPVHRKETITKPKTLNVVRLFIRLFVNFQKKFKFFLAFRIWK